MNEELLPKERLESAIRKGESQFREFKTALEGPPGQKRLRDVRDIKRDIAETLVAFANSEGGQLFVGVEDDGTVTGVPHSANAIEGLLAAPQTNVLAQTPLPSPLKSRIYHDGKLVLLFAVTKSTVAIHQTSDGRCLQRSDRESIPIATEIVHFERQEQRSRSYDRQYVDGADLDSLDIPLIRSLGEQVAPGMSEEKVLQLLDLADYDGFHVRLRRAALLLFANDVQRWHPRCQVRILRVVGTEMRSGKEYNVSSDEIVRGNILTLLVRAWDAIRNHLVQVRLERSGLFEERVMYPEDACREALINAVAHRDYSDEGRGVEVFVYDDRMEVRSPGSLLSTVSVQDLLRLSGAHESRNPFVARTLREARFMREVGEGMRRIFALMKANDLVDPELRAENDNFAITLHHESVFSETDQRWLAAFDGFNLPVDEMKVLLLGRDGALFSTQQVFDALGLVDTEQYRALLSNLQLKGLVLTQVPKATASARARRTKVPVRSVPRFAIRRPIDCERDLVDLVRALDSLTANGRPLAPIDMTQVRSKISPNNLYGRAGASLPQALQALELLDRNRTFTERFRKLAAMYSPRR
ncbi:ATP-binding protein [Micromonospora musae]|nr:ATP-binding protein [Micromonospora musae]